MLATQVNYYTKIYKKTKAMAGFKNREELQRKFKVILSKHTFSECVTEIANLICYEELNVDALNAIIYRHGENIESLKDELMDLILSHISLVLEDNIITDAERYNVGILKLFFRVKEGDFYKHKYSDMKIIIEQEMRRTYSNNFIDKDKAGYRYGIQEMFGLSYSQMGEFKENEIRRALSEGACILNLDTDKVRRV